MEKGGNEGPLLPMNRWQPLRDAPLVHSLRSTSLFAGLPESDLAAIAATAVRLHLNKGEYLFREGEDVAGFYIVRQGVINVHRVASDGREQVIHLFRSGESLAEAALVSDSGYPADARAAEESELLLIPKATFLAQLQSDARLALRMLASMSQHLRVLVTSIESLKLRDAETRLLHWLLNRCPQPPGDTPVEIELGVSKALLASELATRQETLSRLFAKLRDAGHLTIQRRTIRVTSPRELQALFEVNLSGGH